MDRPSDLVGEGKRSARFADAAIVENRVVLGIDTRKAGEEEPVVLETGEVVDSSSVTGAAGLRRLPMTIVVQDHIQLPVHTRSGAAARDFASSRPAIWAHLQAGPVKECVPVH